MRVEVGGQSLTILRQWTTGFSVAAEHAQRLRGLVDVYDEDTHISQCLVVALGEEDGQVDFEYKRRTLTSAGPALDYERPTNLITTV